MALAGVRHGALAGVRPARHSGTLCRLRTDRADDGRRVGAAGTDGDGDRVGADGATARSGAGTRDRRHARAGGRAAAVVSRVSRRVPGRVPAGAGRATARATPARPCAAGGPRRKVTLRELRGRAALSAVHGDGLRLAAGRSQPRARSFRCICGEIGVAADRVPFLAGILFTITAAAAAIGNQASRWLLAQQIGGRARAGDGWRSHARQRRLVFAAGPPGWSAGGRGRLWACARRRDDVDLYGGVAGVCRSDVAGCGVRVSQLRLPGGLAVSPVMAGFLGVVSMRAVFRRGCRRPRRARVAGAAGDGRCCALVNPASCTAADLAPAVEWLRARKARGLSRRIRSMALRSIRSPRRRFAALFELKGRRGGGGASH